jgi:hypothetical protein
MRHSPWALALLALSLPTPALSNPLQRLPIADFLWNGGSYDDNSRAYGYGIPDPSDADRPWQRYSELPDDDLDEAPRSRWRQGLPYGSLGSPSYRYGYPPGRRIPLAVIPATPQPARRCGPGPALVGAAIGGGLGAAISDGSRQRQWALPIGATVGGLLGGVLAGC